MIQPTAVGVEAGPRTLSTPEATVERPVVRGKFLYAGDDKLLVRGVTYGPFRPNGDDCQYHHPRKVDADFAAMARNGINALRTYTVPPTWLLDCARRHRLRVMVGLPWEQHLAFLDDRATRESVARRVSEGVRACAGHPALLAFAIGNEIPSDVVRWYGPRRVRRFLLHLYETAKTEDPAALVTYVNYPSTEYLDLSFVDLLSFNVYLESRERLEAYLARLQNLADDKPLLMAEIGMDSLRHGPQTQARTLDWQVRASFAAGCAGAFVFSWTDEWFRGGCDILDWRFGLTDHERGAKPALHAVRAAFAELPYPSKTAWPRISVVVCTYNGSATLRDCCEGLARLDYPDFEVIVIDDGSSDGSAAIAHEYGYRVVCTGQQGLSRARNRGLEEATGEIIAYIDDDAFPDPGWLTYLAGSFQSSKHVGIGGPNLPPREAGEVGWCVANAPGGPTHVLVSDLVAEHIPGCNMAFRVAALRAVGGFDPRFGIAGDDVDLCWRLEAAGGTLGFSPAAVVWHYPRRSVRAYCRQQFNYGRAEAMLERKWPEKYNRLGHLRWQGRLYGTGAIAASLYRRRRVFHGSCGQALFQSVYEAAPGNLQSLLLMPDWYLIVGGLAILTALGVAWPPLLLAGILLGVAAAAPFVQAAVAASRATFPETARGRFRLHLLTAGLHVLQPLARLGGRLRSGLTPWRRRGARCSAFPRPRTSLIWREQRQDADRWIRQFESGIREAGAVSCRAGEFDRWDVEIHSGLLGGVRLQAMVEEHAGGRQLARFRSRPRVPWPGCAVLALTSGLALAAAVDLAWPVAALLGLAAAALGARAYGDCAAATGVCLAALDGLRSERAP